MGNPSQSYGASLAVWDHTVLPATVTRHKWTRPAITPARQAVTRFTYPEGMEGWVDLGSLIAARPGIEPRPPDRKSDALTVTPPRPRLLPPSVVYLSRVGGLKFTSALNGSQHHEQLAGLIIFDAYVLSCFVEYNSILELRYLRPLPIIRNMTSTDPSTVLLLLKILRLGLDRKVLFTSLKLLGVT